MKKIFIRINNFIKKPLQHLVPENNPERGQVIIIVAMAMIGLVAFVGLAIDTGLVFVGQGRLRRAVDAAALASASNFRQGYDITELRASAYELLVLRLIPMFSPHVRVDDAGRDCIAVDSMRRQRNGKSLH